MTLDVLEKAGPDVRCKVADPGIILSRANVTFRRNGTIVRARNSMLPVLSSKVRPCLAHASRRTAHASCKQHARVEIN